MRNYWLACTLAFCSYSYGAQIEENTPNLGEIRLVPVDPTPEGDNVTVKIVFPEENDVKKSNPVHLQLRVEGFPLATDSDFPRRKDIYNSDDGQSIHVVIDDNPWFMLNEAIMDDADDVEDYFDQTVDYDIPYPLKPGIHLIRAFPVRSYGECLKGDGCYSASIFYVRAKKDSGSIDLNAPYITYNVPQGTIPFENGHPVLLDFYISNCMLSRDGYKVRVTIDGSTQRVLNQWVPYFVYGLNKGNHTIRLELLDRENKLVKGPYTDTQRSFKLE